MIQLTRLNRQAFTVNSDLIKFIERSPDTVLTLTTGEKIVVLEAPDEVVKKVIAFRRTILADADSGTRPSDSAITRMNVHSAEISAHKSPGESDHG